MGNCAGKSNYAYKKKGPSSPKTNTLPRVTIQTNDVRSTILNGFAYSVLPEKTPVEHNNDEINAYRGYTQIYNYIKCDSPEEVPKKPQNEEIVNAPLATNAPSSTGAAVEVEPSSNNVQNFEILAKTSILSITSYDNDDNYFDQDDVNYYKNKQSESERNPYMMKRRAPNNKPSKMRYKLGLYLGQGSFGRVFMSMNTDTGYLMAVKTINLKELKYEKDKELDKYLYNLPQKIEAVHTEIRLLKNLNHPNIVKYFGSSRTEEYLNIFLELVYTGSLYNVLQKFGPLNDKVLKSYLTQILSGLEYLHSHKVVHRDIKSANVLVDVNGTCKLTDFGSAKRLLLNEGAHGYQKLIGTVNWMAPEVIRGQDAGRFSDIWSLGCTVLEMATGKPPFLYFENQLTAMYSIAKNNLLPDIPYNLSKQLRDFLTQCFQPDAKKRPNVRKLLRHPFVCDNNDDQNQSKSRSSRDSINKSRTSCRPLRVIPEENTLECNVSATGSVKKNDDKFFKNNMVESGHLLNQKEYSPPSQPKKSPQYPHSALLNRPNSSKILYENDQEDSYYSKNKRLRSNSLELYNVPEIDEIDDCNLSDEKSQPPVNTYDHYSNKIKNSSYKSKPFFEVAYK